LPDESSMASVTPRESKKETRLAVPRSLNDPLGFMVSHLKKIATKDLTGSKGVFLRPMKPADSPPDVEVQRLKARQNHTLPTVRTLMRCALFGYGRPQLRQATFISSRPILIHLLWDVLALDPKLTARADFSFQMGTISFRRSMP